MSAETKEETKTEIEQTDPTSDSESDHETEDDSDTKELHEKLEKHKTMIFRGLTALIAVDIGVAAMLAKNRTSDQSMMDRLLDFENDTLDCGIASVLRVITMILMASVTILLGSPDYHDNNDATERSRIQRLQIVIMQYVMTLWAKLMLWNDDEEEDTSNKPQKLISSLKGKRVTEKVNQSLKTGDMGSIVQTFDAQEIVQQYTDIDSQDLADFWKSTLWLLTFSAAAVYQAYLGVKIVFFQPGSLESGDNLYKFIAMFSVTIVVSHLELVLAKMYIDDATEPTNKFYDSDVHEHPLFKRKVPNHYCNFCWDTIKTQCYRCQKCDFDCCRKCWKKKKDARLTAENALRDDKGVCEDENKPVTMWEYFRRLIMFHAPHWKVLLVGVVTMIAMSLINVVMPASKGRLLDRMVEQNGDRFMAEVKKYVLLTVITGVFTSIKNVAMSHIKEKITCEVQQTLFERVMNNDTAFFDNSSVGSLQERVNWGLSQVLSPFSNFLKSITVDVVGLVGCGFMCWTTSWRLTLLSFTTLGPISYFTMIFNQWHRSNASITWKLGRDMWDVSYQAFDNVKTVRSFAKEPELVRHFCQLRNELHTVQKKTAIMNALNQTVSSWFGLAARTIITWAAGTLILFHGDAVLTLGSMLTFEAYWGKLQSHIYALRRLYPSIQTSLFKARQIFRTLDNKPSIEARLDIKKNDPTATDGIPLNSIDGDIVFNDVSFRYQVNKSNILKNLSLTIPHGKVTALVGRSGHGKTTLVSLLQRFYDPQEGSITIGGVNIKDFDPHSLRANVGAVSQETQLFRTTVTRNIGYGLDAYTEDDIQTACKLANAHDFIEKFDDKYDTRCGSRGCRLSGGQKQRLAIARMLMTRPKLMLLDEATSSLDAESEALVQASLEKAIEEEKCTVVLVAHRLSTVVNADQIAVIDDGQVAEVGTHDELIKKDGIYAKLVHRQLNLRDEMRARVGTDTGATDGKPVDTIDSLIDTIKAEKEKLEEDTKKAVDTIDAKSDVSDAKSDAVEV